MRAVGQLDQADLLSGASPLPDDDRTRRLRRTGQVRGTRPPRPERSATRSASARTASTTSQLSWAVGCTASATPRTRSAPSCRSSWESRPSAALPGSALRPAESVHSSGRGWISTVGDHRALAARGVLVVDPKAHHLLISLHACGNSGERSTRAVAVPQRRTVPGRHRIWQRPPRTRSALGAHTRVRPGHGGRSGLTAGAALPQRHERRERQTCRTATRADGTRADRAQDRSHTGRPPQRPHAQALDPTGPAHRSWFPQIDRDRADRGCPRGEARARRRWVRRARAPASRTPDGRSGTLGGEVCVRCRRAGRRRSREPVASGSPVRSRGCGSPTSAAGQP